MDKYTIVISAFPACGKSSMYRKYSEYYEDNKNNPLSFKILDSDSSLFSWIYDENGNKTNVRNPDFPQNYINHIKERIGKEDVIFISSHKVVRDALRENGIKYSIFYPDKSLKEEWMRRYKERGNDENFIKFQEEHWEEFIEDIHNEIFPRKYKITDPNGGINIITFANILKVEGLY